MDAPRPRYVASPRRVREDRRFAAGQGRFVADIALPGMRHVALVACPHAAARIVAIDKAAALALPGVRCVIDGHDLAAATQPLPNGLDTPRVRRWPLAVGAARYCGEWVVAVVADTRAIAEDAAELVAVDYDPLAFVLDAEEAIGPRGPIVHPAHGSNVLLDRRFAFGNVDRDFARSTHRTAFRLRWGRSAALPIETFGVVASHDPWRGVLDLWASAQAPRHAEEVARILGLPSLGVRVHNSVDVGGGFGGKRGLKHAVLVGYLARLLGDPVRLVEDRLENMRGGDAHGPERIFDVEVAFDDSGVIAAMKMRAIDNVGAYAGPAALQLGAPIGAIVGPYRIASVLYHAIAVTTNKTPQESMRGAGQAPTNYAIERAIDEVAARLGLDRVGVRQRNLIAAEEFPHTIASGTTYDSGDYHAVIEKVLARANYPRLIAERDQLRAQGLLAGIGIAAVLAPGGGNFAHGPLLNPAMTTTTFMESCRVVIDAAGGVVATIHAGSAGQGHETLVATIVGKVLEIDPDAVQIARPDSIAALPSDGAVGSRMAIMLGGAAAQAARMLRAKLVAIGAHVLDTPPERTAYQSGVVYDAKAPQRRLIWQDLVQIAHRNYFRLPPGFEPGLAASHVMQVPAGGKLPTGDGRVQMDPCFSFEFHLLLLTVDPDLGRPEFRQWFVGHDCGTVINPMIVRGMTLGGIAQGIGAALFEELTHDAQGRPATASLADYVLPSARDVPQIEILRHVTRSPLTAFGQKGAGASGYLGAPAAISGAVNDALRPLGSAVNRLPMKMSALGDLIAVAREKAGAKPGGAA
ncbi:MAG: xanthine dehydrogenase family protein [Proteobacteria bacterium]|nr:xanthine dehydrogenase family protein [Pseudomonadota bacterium]